MLLASLLALTLAQQQDDSLDAKVNARIAKTQGTVSLFAKNLDTGRTYGVNPDAKVRTASTIKLPVMVDIRRCHGYCRGQVDKTTPRGSTLW